MTAFWNLLSPQSSRSLHADLLYAGCVLLAWLFLSGLEVAVAGSTGALKLAIITDQGPFNWPIAPLLLGAFTLALYWVRIARYTVESAPVLQHRLQRFTLLVLGLCLVRLAALWHPLTALFPALTLLWTPHAAWAITLGALGYIHGPAESSQDEPHRQKIDPIIGGTLFFVCAVAYGTYALYFCQVTMLHGDEGQYLRVTQSLLHDGDMDLANNLDLEQTNEFHVREFSVHKAPASPEGKIHSVHPIGLSILLIPAYWTGLELWQNPRLGAALFTSLLSSLCIPLLYAWLRRLDIHRYTALIAVLITASTSPFFFYSNQLFPEIPALFISLIVLWLLAHWQRPGGSYRPLSPSLEIPLLTLCTALLSFLPFLHARYAPLGVLCGSAILAQAWFSPRRRMALSAIGATVALALYALVSFHYAFSGDWMGPFRPGNAWGEDALALSTWPISLPGHWLNVGKGLISAAPIFFFSLLGWAVLAHKRDRSILVVAGLYGTTAAMNGLHPDWGFGYAYPARFLVTALPALVFGLALALPLVMRQPLGAFLAAFALAVSLETIVETLPFPEVGYNGRNLLMRTISDFYPFSVHFLPSEKPENGLFYVSFWALLAAAVYVWMIKLSDAPPRWRWVLGLVTLSLPSLWGQTDTAAARLAAVSTSSNVFSPYMRFLRADLPLEDRQTLKATVPLRPTGIVRPDARGTLSVVPNTTPAAFINQSVLLMPLANLAPYSCLFKLSFPDLQFENPPGGYSGHLILTNRQTVKAQSPWENRLSLPLASETGLPNPINLYVREPGVRYAYVEYSGTGSLQVGKIEAQVIPMRNLARQSRRVDHIEIPSSAHSEGLNRVQSFPALEPGYYRVHFSVRGSAWRTLFQRNPSPILMAAYPTLVSSETMKLYIDEWFGQDRIANPTINHASYYRPIGESIAPPWEKTWPMGEGVFELAFFQPQRREINILLRYDGDLDLELESISIYRDTYGKI